jgi:HEAT repeat protein
MERGESLVRGACSKALIEVRPTKALVPTLIGSLKSRDEGVRAHAAELLGRIGPEARGAVPALIAVWREPFGREDRDRPDAVSWSRFAARKAAQALGKMGPSREAIAALLDEISAEKVERVLAAPPTIGKSGSPTSVDDRARLAASLRVSAAVGALGEIGPPAAAALPALIAAYKKSLETRVVMGFNAIPVALGRIAPSSPLAPDVLAVLIRALDAQNSFTRQGAIEALERFGQEASAAFPKLRALQDDPDIYVRTAAAKSLTALEAAHKPNVGAGQPQTAFSRNSTRLPGLPGATRPAQ